MDDTVAPDQVSPRLPAVAEAANFAGVSEKTICQVLDARRLKHARIGQT